MLLIVSCGALGSRKVVGELSSNQAKDFRAKFPRDLNNAGELKTPTAELYPQAAEVKPQTSELKSKTLDLKS